jgi:hypothetical protein
MKSKSASSQQSFMGTAADIPTFLANRDQAERDLILAVKAIHQIEEADPLFTPIGVLSRHFSIIVTSGKLAKDGSENYSLAIVRRETELVILD